MNCALCRTELPDGKGFIFCSQCGAPEFRGDMTSPFVALGVSKQFAQDEGAIEERYYGLSKRLHPDRFAGAPQTAKLRIQALSAALNQAYMALRKPESRLEALLKSAGALKEQERSPCGPEKQAPIPMELAETFFEIQEAAMEDEAHFREMAGKFRSELEGKRQDLTQRMYEIAAKAGWDDPASAQTRAEIEKIMDLRRQRSYLRSMLENLERLEATTHG